MAQEYLEEEEETASTSEKILAIVYPRIRSFLSGTASGIAKCVVGHPFDTMYVFMHDIHHIS